MKDWDDYRYFLAVAEQGSVSAAARSLGTSQPTVGRRIALLEKRLDARLFHRRPTGFRLTELGQQVRERARLIEREAQWIERKVSHADRAPEGRVVLSTTEDFGCFCLAPLLGDFHRAHPEIDLDLVVAYHAIDLLGGEADIALRIGRPRSPQLVGRRLGKVRFRLYASKGYLERHREPRSTADLADHALIESTRQLNDFPQTAWLRRNGRGARVAFACDNIMVQLSALEAGLGIMALPSYMGDGNRSLRVILPDQLDLALDLWVLAPRDLGKVPRVRAVLDFLAGRLRVRLAEPQAAT